MSLYFADVFTFLSQQGVPRGTPVQNLFTLIHTPEAWINRSLVGCSQSQAVSQLQAMTLAQYLGLTSVPHEHRSTDRSCTAIAMERCSVIVSERVLSRTLSPRKQRPIQGAEFRGRLFQEPNTHVRWRPRGGPKLVQASGFPSKALWAKMGACSHLSVGANRANLILETTKHLGTSLDSSALTGGQPTVRG